VPKEVGGEGFAFAVSFDELFGSMKLAPLLNVLGQKTSLSIGVSEKDTASAWPGGGDVLEAQLRSRPFLEEAVDPNGHFQVLYDSPERTTWWVLTRSSDRSVPNGATAPRDILAQCARQELLAVDPSRPGITQIVCTRLVFADDVVIEYSFNYVNLPHVAEMDTAVLALVNRWACDAARP
jgi:hypothetical protein